MTYSINLEIQFLLTSVAYFLFFFQLNFEKGTFDLSSVPIQHFFVN